MILCCLPDGNHKITPQSFVIQRRIARLSWTKYAIFICWYCWRATLSTIIGPANTRFTLLLLFLLLSISCSHIVSNVLFSPLANNIMCSEQWANNINGYELLLSLYIHVCTSEIRSSSFEHSSSSSRNWRHRGPFNGNCACNVRNNNRKIIESNNLQGCIQLNELQNL